jgi:hypothetical protein
MMPEVLLGTSCSIIEITLFWTLTVVGTLPQGPRYSGCHKSDAWLGQESWGTKNGTMTLKEGLGTFKETTTNSWRIFVYSWAPNSLAAYHSILCKTGCSGKLKISFQLLLKSINPNGHIFQTVCVCLLPGRQMNTTYWSSCSWSKELE